MIEHDKGVNKILMHTRRGSKLMNKFVAFVCVFSYDLLMAPSLKFYTSGVSLLVWCNASIGLEW